MGLAFACYYAVLKWRGPAATLTTQTEWDRHIPFWPVWIYVYLIVYPLGPPLLGIMRRATFVWYVRRGLLAVAVSVLVFAIVPTKTVRPSDDELDGGLTADHYRAMVGIDDPPANAAPSLHVSLSCLLAIALSRDFPRWWLVIILCAGLVCVATLFTRQHHLIDVAGGALLALVVAWPWGRTDPVQGKTPSDR